jgi:transposase-like protein
MPFKSRWTPEDKMQIVAGSLNTSISIAELCRKHNLSPGVFYSWKEKFIEGGKAGSDGLRQRQRRREQGAARRDRTPEEVDRGADDRQRRF